MGVPPEVRIPLENQRMMMLYQPALGESLDSIEEDEHILVHGFAFRNVLALSTVEFDELFA